MSAGLTKGDCPDEDGCSPLKTTKILLQILADEINITLRMQKDYVNTAQIYAVLLEKKTNKKYVIKISETTVLFMHSPDQEVKRVWR
ncbi:MAG: hypothetical protein K6D96_06020 [Acetatifactor sp.]|nr:hypothetical protein [Acetatifactor sp.]